MKINYRLEVVYQVFEKKGKTFLKRLIMFLIQKNHSKIEVM